MNFLAAVASPHGGAVLGSDHLFEVAVEVTFSPDPDESWDQLAWSLLRSVKTLVRWPS